MKTKLIGLIASVALMGSSAALAGDNSKKGDTQHTQSQGATGGSGQVTEGSSGSLGQGGAGSGSMGQGGSGQTNQGGTPGQMNPGTSGQVGSTQQLGASELDGRVVKSNKKMVWVEHAGVVVPLTINRQTQFAGQDIKRAQDIKEGDRIRASFTVQETNNIATSIQKSDGSSLGGSGSGTGAGSTGSDMGSGTGSGGSGMGSGSEIPLPPSPIDNGTGGSGTGTGTDTGTDTGTGLEPPDISDEGTSSDLGSDSSRSGDY